MLGNTTSESENCMKHEPDEAVSPKEIKAANPVKKKPKKIPICWFYSKNKSCKFEENCRYRHSSPTKSKPSEVVKRSNEDDENKEQSIELSTNGSNERDDESELRESCEGQGLDDVGKPQEIKNDTPQEKNDGNSLKIEKGKRPCMFFFRFKHCKFGDDCNFSHDKSSKKRHKDPNKKTKIEDESKVANGSSEASKSNENSKRYLPTKNIKLDELTEEMIQELRTIELTQLKKRFRGNQIKKSDEGLHVVMVKATDPDWPFDVQHVWMEVDIPEKYPKEILKVYVAVNGNEILPRLLISHLNDAVAGWLLEKFNLNSSNSVTELVFRPFLRWFDKNMERLFEEGLRAVKREIAAKSAGLEFVSYKELKVPDAKSNSEVDEQKSEDLDLDDLKVHVRDSPDEKYEPISADVKSACLDLCNLSLKAEPAVHIATDDNKQPKGTAIKVIDFTLSENVATLVCSKISVVLQCTRCRTKVDFDGQPKKPKRLSCQKCNHIMNATFRPAMLHQFSAVIGYLDLEGCKAFDMILLKCEFNATCLNCNKSTMVSGLASGQTTNTYCFICHNKLTICLNVFKFQILDEISMSDKIDKKLIKKKKELKDPAIQDGKPLPDSGICKHYKKSFRWLRFPCCGKCYPCDLCHDEKETDHEMKFAIRMLCGHCAKEQTYAADKPCTRCHADLTKKSTGHWDNGKGCRNKVKMSKDDKQKYAGMNKTTAKTVEEKRASKKTK